MSDWYVKTAKGKHGPIEFSKLKQFASEGKLKPSTKIASPDKTKGKWLEVGKIPELVKLLPSDSPPPSSGVREDSGVREENRQSRKAKNQGGGQSGPRPKVAAVPKRAKPKRHPYSRVMLIVTWASAIVAGIAGTGLVLLAATQGERVQGKMLVLAPFIFGTLGYMAGVAFSFLFAPTKYLESESGRKWMKLVGTETIPSARVVCGILAALVVGLFLAIAIAFINEQ